MPERYQSSRQASPPASNRRQAAADAELAESLRIDEDNIDTCLVDQPGRFYQAAEAVAQANAARDTIKLELDELLAELGQLVRQAAADAEEKITEAGIQMKLTSMPKVQAKQRELLQTRSRAEHALALKEAYHQRSFMLRELVALQLAELNNLSIERGANSARRVVGEQARERTEASRREERLGRRQES